MKTVRLELNPIELGFLCGVLQHRRKGSDEPLAMTDAILARMHKLAEAFYTEETKK